MEKKILYINPNSEFDYFGLSQEEMLAQAKEDNDAEIYTIEGFAQAFNDEIISDLGYIFVIYGLGID